MNIEKQTERLAKVETTLWGGYGNDGLNARSNEHTRQIGELFEKNEQLNIRVEERLAGIYSRLAILAGSLLVGCVGIIGTILVKG